MFSLKVRERAGRVVVCCVCVWGGLALPPHFLCESKEKCSPKLFDTFMLENKEVVTVAQKKMQ